MAATDGTLVLGVLRGDRAAFAELYDRRARLIRAICFDATQDLQSATDLTQEVFVRAFQRLGDLHDPQRFTPWLAAIARHVCREWQRTRQKERLRRRALMNDAPCPAPREDVDEQVFALREAMKALPDKERLALHAFYLQEMDAEQARAALGLSRSGLYHVLASARRRLARVLRKQEVVP